MDNGTFNENDEQKNTSITKTTTYADYVKVIGPEIAQFYGRKVLYDDYLPEELNTGNETETVKIISDILTHIWSLHGENANEIDYLEKYIEVTNQYLVKEKI